MQIFDYIADSNHFQCIREKSPNDARATARFYNCKPMAKRWKPFEVVIDSRFPVGDFPSLGRAPVFSERAWKTLEPLIGKSVEALPINHPSKKPYYAINVLEVVDCLDLKRSELAYYSDGKVMDVDKYVFDRSRLPKCHMFRLEQLKIRSGFVSGEFKVAVEEAKLKGLVFRQLYPPVKKKP